MKCVLVILAFCLLVYLFGRSWYATSKYNAFITKKYPEKSKELFVFFWRYRPGQTMRFNKAQELGDDELSKLAIKCKKALYGGLISWLVFILVFLFWRSR